MTLEFRKMNGAGNDFVVFDARKQKINLSTQQVLEISARSNKITQGCDQLIVMEPSSKADVFMRIYNSDSSEVDACGNATRCVAHLLEKELGRLPVTIETNAGILQGLEKSLADSDYIMVDMGKPKFDWKDIPLALTTEESAKKVTEFSGLQNPIFVSMGNPHVVFFMDEVPSDEFVKDMGSKLEHFSAVFPKKVNVSFVKLPKIANDIAFIDVKIWERGAGLTQACGTGACAILAATNLSYNDIENIIVKFKNSEQFVYVSISDNRHILLGGEVVEEFGGILEL